MERKNATVQTGTRIIIADHQAAFMDHIHLLIANEPNWECVLKVSKGIQLINFLKSSVNHTDLIIMGTMSVGSKVESITYARYITTYFPKVKIILISYHRIGAYIMDMYRAGVQGYLFRNFDSTELLSCIKAVIQGQKYYEGKVQQSMLAHQSYLNAPDDDDIYLTPNEKNLLQWLEQGLDWSRIETLLNIRRSSIEAQWKNITRKIGLEDQKTIIKLALNKGWLDE